MIRSSYKTNPEVAGIAVALVTYILEPSISHEVVQLPPARRSLNAGIDFRAVNVSVGHDTVIVVLVMRGMKGIGSIWVFQVSI